MDLVETALARNSKEGLYLASSIYEGAGIINAQEWEIAVNRVGGIRTLDEAINWLKERALYNCKEMDERRQKRKDNGISSKEIRICYFAEFTETSAESESLYRCLEEATGNEKEHELNFLEAYKTETGYEFRINGVVVEGRTRDVSMTITDSVEVAQELVDEGSIDALMLNYSIKEEFREKVKELSERAEEKGIKSTNYSFMRVDDHLKTDEQNLLIYMFAI
jgi:undecaprenyl pyrophosphate synthase